MTGPWRKAVRDLWNERTRTAMVVLAIALGIAGFSTVLSSRAILTRELNDDYLATNPASATLETDVVDASLVKAVLAKGDVSDAEARRVISGLIRTGPLEWRTLQLFVVDDYANIRISRLLPQKGAWPPATGEILVERDAMQVARARIGDTLTVKSTRGAERELRLSGTVHDVGQAQARMENIVYGYITVATLAQLGEEPALDQLNILVAGNRFDEQHVRNVSENVRQLLERSGHPVRRVVVPTPGKHPHEKIMGLLLLGMSTFGVLIVALSGIIVVNLLTALMASQVRQIGVMKAVGATRGQIARLYLGQAVVLGGAALAVAVPAGMWGSRVLCRAMAVFLNFDIDSFAVPPAIYAVIALVGIVIPLLAAAYPVWRASRVPAREALADFGVGGTAFGATALDRALGRVSGSARPIVYALRNSLRHRTRFVLTVLTLGAGGLFFMSALNVRASLVNTLDRMFASKRFDLTLKLASQYPRETIERALRQTPGIARWEGWIVTEASIADGANAARDASGGLHSSGQAGSGHSQGGDRFRVIALPPQSQLMTFEISSGRALGPDDADTIVVNSALAAKYPRLRPGDSVALRMGPGQPTFRIAGIAREPFSPPVAYIPLRFFEERPGHEGMANVVALALERSDAATISRIKGELEHSFAKEGVGVSSSVVKGEGRYGFDQHMLMIYVFLVIVSGILAGVGGLSLATTMSINVLERRREMGVLRAIGATSTAVWLIVVTEGLLAGLLSWSLAVAAAWPLSKGLGDLIATIMFKSGLDFSFETSGLWIWLAVSVGLGAASSFLPAWQASRRPVREALGYE